MHPKSPEGVIVFFFQKGSWMLMGYLLVLFEVLIPRQIKSQQRVPLLTRVAISRLGWDTTRCLEKRWAGLCLSYSCCLSRLQQHGDAPCLGEGCPRAPTSLLSRSQTALSSVLCTKASWWWVPNVWGWDRGPDARWGFFSMGKTHTQSPGKGCKGCVKAPKGPQHGCSVLTHQNHTTRWEGIC